MPWNFTLQPFANPRTGTKNSQIPTPKIQIPKRVGVRYAPYVARGPIRAVYDSVCPLVDDWQRLKRSTSERIGEAQCALVNSWREHQRDTLTQRCIIVSASHHPHRHPSASTSGEKAEQAARADCGSAGDRTGCARSKNSAYLFTIPLDERETASSGGLAP